MMTTRPPWYDDQLDEERRAMLRLLVQHTNGTMDDATLEAAILRWNDQVEAAKRRAHAPETGG